MVLAQSIMCLNVTDHTTITHIACMPLCHKVMQIQRAGRRKYGAYRLFNKKTSLLSIFQLYLTYDFTVVANADCCTIAAGKYVEILYHTIVI